MPGSTDWILCEESGASDIEIKADGVTIGTTDSEAHGVRGRHQGTGANAITSRNANITTAGTLTNGVNATHEGSGKIKVYLRGTTIMVKGRGTDGVFGDHHQSGGIEIDVRDTAIATESSAVDSNGRTTSHGIWGWIRSSAGTGNIDIDVQGGSIRTTGTGSYGIYGLYQGSGDIDIATSGGHSVTTTGSSAHGIRAYHTGTASARRIAITIGRRDDARGAGASGVRIGSVSAVGAAIGAADVAVAGDRGFC